MIEQAFGEYTFLLHHTDLDFQVPESTLFFHTPKFVMRNGDKNLMCFKIMKQDQLLGYIFFSMDNGIAVSMRSSPFGGFVGLVNLENDLIKSFFRFIIKSLRNDQVSQIEIHHSPICYGYDYDNALRNSGFEIMRKDYNQHLVMDTAIFRSKLNKDKTYRLNLCEKSSFTTAVLEYSAFKSAYELVRENMLEKEYPLTLSYTELMQATELFPGRYLAFGVFDAEQLIGTTMAVKINDRILYNFYHGYKNDYRKYSPLVLALDCEYRYARDHGIKLLDLGVSSVKGKLNEGLFQFKKSVGCEVEDKTVYRCLL